jgi:hypothetical protein
MQELMLVKGGMLLNLLCQGLDPEATYVVMRWFIIYWLNSICPVCEVLEFYVCVLQFYLNC